VTTIAEFFKEFGVGLAERTDLTAGQVYKCAIVPARGDKWNSYARFSVFLCRFIESGSCPFSAAFSASLGTLHAILLRSAYCLSHGHSVV